MTTVTFTEFRKHASGLITDVENGETLVILRHGRPVAEVSPVASAPKGLPSWKRHHTPLVIPGVSLSKAILEEREESSY